MILSIVTFSNATIFFVTNVIQDRVDIKISCRDEVITHMDWNIIPYKKSFAFAVHKDILFKEKRKIRCYVQSPMEQDKHFTLYNPFVDEDECRQQCNRYIKKEAVYVYNYPFKGFTSSIPYDDPPL